MEEVGELVDSIPPKQVDDGSPLVFLESTTIQKRFRKWAAVVRQYQTSRGGQEDDVEECPQII
jgi:hypothetical protein